MIPGKAGFSRDGEKVGKVIAVDPVDVVEKGCFIPTDVYIRGSPRQAARP